MDLTTSLSPVLKFFARCHLRELDREFLRQVDDFGLRASLENCQIQIPEEAELVALSEQYFLHYLHPRGHYPPVQSLWAEGRYDGAAALRVQQLATLAGLEPASPVRRVPVDHVGSILELLAALSPEQAPVAAELRTSHLDWARPFLSKVATADGFYGQLARTTAELLDTLQSES